MSDREHGLPRNPRTQHVLRREQLARRAWRKVDAALRRSSTYPHPAGRIQRIETHISVIYLAGRFAYKIKKPVNPGFVDFTAPAARQQACRDEVRLNRRLAPELRYRVVTIVPRARGYTIGGDAAAHEYAVRMRRFGAGQLFSHLLAGGTLGPAEIDRLAERLAACHRLAPARPPRRRYGSACVIRAQMHTVLGALERASGVPVPAELTHWCGHEGARLAEHFELRRSGGFVRECHGDLHLDNVVCRNRHVLMFDCIEFSAELRWIDVASDLGFVLMDLRVGRDSLSFRQNASKQLI
jgi:aminoglycoside phosphotransferase family enzyme